MESLTLTDLLTKCPKDEFVKFLHGIVDSLCLRNQLMFKDFSEIWSLEEWWQVTDHCKDLCKECVRNSWTKEEVMQQISSIEEQHKEILYMVVSVRKDELRKVLLEETTYISNSQLEDFDWKVKMVVASDKLSSIQEPLVTLDLDVNSKQGKNMVSVEMNKDELKELITSLEAANRAMQQLST